MRSSEFKVELQLPKRIHKQTPLERDVITLISKLINQINMKSHQEFRTITLISTTVQHKSLLRVIIKFRSVV